MRTVTVPAYIVKLLAPALAASILATAARAQTEPVHVASLRELWSVTADSTIFAAPRSIVAIGAECALWITDPLSGVWRMPCDGGVPVQAGRLGEGPNDFSRPLFAASLRGDTVGVWDGALQRLSLFLANGEFAGSRSLSVPEFLDGSVAGLAPGATPGTLLALTTKSSPIGEKTDDLDRILTLRADGSVRDSLAAMPGSQWVTYQAGDSLVRVGAPQQRRAFAGFFRDGGFLIASSDDARVDVYDASGRRLRTVTLPLPAPAGVTKSDRDAYADSVRRSSDREMEMLHTDDSLRVRVRADIDRMLRDGVTFPAMRQRYDRLVLDEREDDALDPPPGHRALVRPHLASLHARQSGRVPLAGRSAPGRCGCSGVSRRRVVRRRTAA